MSQGVVTKHLIQLVAKQVEDAGLVVWHDPEGHYRSVTSEPQLRRELVPWKEAKSFRGGLMDGKYVWSSIGKQLREKGLVSL